MKMNKNCELGLQEYQRKLKLGEVVKLNPTEKAKANPRSLRFAINAKCYDCCCYEINEVRLCTSTECPLYGVRPYQKQ